MEKQAKRNKSKRPIGKQKYFKRRSQVFRRLGGRRGGGYETDEAFRIKCL